MSLKDYAVNRDKFQLRKDGRHALSLDFPCCHCSYCFKVETDEPCRTCDHNSNAVKNPPPVQSDIPCECGSGYNPECQAHYPQPVQPDQSDEDRREKSESRAGIRPFELRGPTNH